MTDSVPRIASPKGKMGIIIGVQIAILVLINIASFAFGAASGSVSDGAMARVVVALAGTLLQIAILLCATLFMAISKKTSAPIWWTALGVITVLALPTLWLAGAF